MSTVFEDAVRVGNIFRIFDFHKVLLQVRWKSLWYIENFLTVTSQLVKEFWKSVHICQSYYQTSRGILFWDTVYNGTLIGTHTRPTQQCKFEWPWVTERRQNSLRHGASRGFSATAELLVKLTTINWPSLRLPVPWISARKL